MAVGSESDGRYTISLDPTCELVFCVSKVPYHLYIFLTKNKKCDDGGREIVLQIDLLVIYLYGMSTGTPDHRLPINVVNFLVWLSPVLS